MVRTGQVLQERRAPDGGGGARRGAHGGAGRAGARAGARGALDAQADAHHTRAALHHRLPPRVRQEQVRFTLFVNL